MGNREREILRKSFGFILRRASNGFLHIHQNTVRVRRAHFDVSEHINDLNTRAIRSSCLFVLVKREVVTCDVPQLDAVDLKDGTNFRAEISGSCHCSSGKDHEDQQCRFTRGKERSSLACFLEAIVEKQLQKSPNDEQRGPVADNVSPNSNVVPELCRQQKASDEDQRDTPKNHSCTSTHGRIIGDRLESVPRLKLSPEYTGPRKVSNSFCVSEIIAQL